MKNTADFSNTLKYLGFQYFLCFISYLLYSLAFIADTSLLPASNLLLIVAKGIAYLFPVQSKTFNRVYDGHDVITKARTGTGKTV